MLLAVALVNAVVSRLTDCLDLNAPRATGPVTALVIRPPVIPIADLQTIYSVSEVDRALRDDTATRNEGLKSWYDRMRELGGSRYIIKPSSTTAVDDLGEASPNFTGVIDDLRKYLALAIAGNEAFQFTPMLLVGEPGLGKLLLDAFGTAQLAGRDHLVPEDIDAKKLCGRKARLGF